MKKFVTYIGVVVPKSISNRPKPPTDTKKSSEFQIIGHILHVKNSPNSICSYWADSANIWIAHKADCPQECHLFISKKHPHLPPL